MKSRNSSADPVAVGHYNAAPSTPKVFAASLVDKTDEQLEELLRTLEEELAQPPNARGHVRRELEEVVWEIERREATRRTRERRQTNVEGRQIDAESMGDEPGVWVHGRPLDERERQDLATFIRWVMAQ